MDEKFWHAANVAMPAAWLTAFLPDPTYHLVALSGVILGVGLLALGHDAGRVDDFLQPAMLSAWRSVVLSVAKHLISLEVRAAAMIAAITESLAAQLAARRPEPPAAAPRHLPTPALTPRFLQIPRVRLA
jgi:hypothetical protein